MDHPTTIVLDSDIVAYQAAAVAEQAINWGDGLWTIHAFEQDGLKALEDLLASLKDKTDCQRVVHALSDSENFRKKVLPTYKSNRKDTRKPMLLAFLKDYIRENYEVFQRPGLEGDDILGIIGTKPSIIGEKEVLIVTIDKDMKTLPVRQYHFHHDEFLIPTEDEANFYHMMQTLTGDTTDGYSGCPGIGPVTAQKILEECTTPAERWEAVVKQFEKKKLSADEALVQARVARILQASDYDFKKKEPILWNPPTK